MDLIEAVKSNDIDNVRRLLLDDNIDINIQEDDKDNYGYRYTALMWAIDNQNIEIINLLLNNNNIDINIQIKYGITALMRAVYKQNIEIIILLLNYSNTDINAKDIVIYLLIIIILLYVFIIRMATLLLIWLLKVDIKILCDCWYLLHLILILRMLNIIRE